LSATGEANTTINWYTDPIGGTSIGNSSTFTTPVLNTTTIFYASATLGTCVSATRTAVTATIIPVPAAPSGNGGSNCPGNSVQLSATPIANATINWFDVSTGGTSLAPGETFTTPGISANTTYYASATINGCESVRTPVLATIKITPAPTGLGASRSDAGTLVLTASSAIPEATFKWYDSPQGGTVIGSNPTFTTPIISLTTTYYVSATIDGCESVLTSVIASINPCPGPPSIPSRFICEPGTVTLVANAQADSVFWYNLPSGGLPLAKGLSFTTAQLTITRTFYASTKTSNCESERVPVDAEIRNRPTSVKGTGDTLCGQGILVLNATSIDSKKISWFESNSSIAVLDTGKIFTTPIISDTTYYYAAVDSNGCQSIRTKIAANIKPIPQPDAKVDRSEISIGESAFLSAIEGGTYTWTPDASLNSGKVSNPKATPEVTTLYTVMVVLNGCTGSDTITIHVNDQTQIPNVFTPNKDGVGDTWVIPKALSNSGNKLKVFSRWGTVVYEVNGYKNDWDGGDIPDGTYYYVYDDGKDKQTGSITIIH